MPKVQNLPFLADKTGTEHRIGIPLQNRFDQPRVIPGIIFQIGILEDRQIAGHFRNRPANRRAFALVFPLLNDFQFRVPPRQFLGDLPGAVRRSVIDQNDFSD